MKRCCFFFLAFVAVVFLAVASGSFDSRSGMNNKKGIASQSTIASQEELELTGPNHVKSNGGGTFKNSKP